MKHKILIHPGLYNSGPGHWQTIWEASLPNAMRVQQANWQAPDRTEWVRTLNAAILDTPGPVILVAHSLGCATVAWWASEYGRTAHAARVEAALLVAPPDVEQPGFPEFVTGFAPMPHCRLPFKALVVASSDDPWCPRVSRAQAWATDWGAGFHDIGARGHINGESGLDTWPQGRMWLAEMAGTELR